MLPSEASCLQVPGPGETRLYSKMKKQNKIRPLKEQKDGIFEERLKQKEKKTLA